MEAQDLSRGTYSSETIHLEGPSMNFLGPRIGNIFLEIQIILEITGLLLEPHKKHDQIVPQTRFSFYPEIAQMPSVYVTMSRLYNGLLCPFHHSFFAE